MPISLSQLFIFAFALIASATLFGAEYDLDSDNAHVRLLTLDDFDTYGYSAMSWGPGGVYNFKKKGDYHAAYIKPAEDAERGKVGEFVFPRANLSDGYRYIGYRLPIDPAFNQFRFWIKRTAGAKTVDLHLESRQHGYQNFVVPIELSDDWQEVVLDFRAIQAQIKGQQLTYDPDHLHHIRFANRNEAVAFRVDDLTVWGNVNLGGENLFLRRPFGTPWFHDAAKAIKLQYRLLGPQTEALKLEFDLIRFVDRKTIQHKQITLPAGEGERPLELDGGKLEPGYYQVDLRLKRGGKLLEELQDFFYVNKAVPAGEHANVVSIEFEGGSLAPGQLESLAQAGIAKLRTQFDNFLWHYVEPIQGVYVFNGSDLAVEWAARYRMQWVPVLGCTPSYLRPPEPHDKGSQMYGWIHKNIAVEKVDRQAWSNYIERIVSHYKGKIDQWEIWNEADWNYSRSENHKRASNAFFVGESKEYYELLKLAYQAAKRANSACTVISSGISMHGGHTDPDFVSKLVSKGFGAYCDALGVHGYEPWEGSQKRVKAMRRKFKNKPFWQTEVGMYEFKPDLADFNEKWPAYIGKAMDYITNGTETYTFFIASRWPQSLCLLNMNGSPNMVMAAIMTHSRFMNGATDFTKDSRGGKDLYAFRYYEGWCVMVKGSGKVRIQASGPVYYGDALGRQAEVPKAKLKSFQLPAKLTYLYSPSKFTVK